MRHGIDLQMPAGRNLVFVESCDEIVDDGRASLNVLDPRRKAARKK
ncbi:MAG: hypothetical protein HY000_32470 [Planctomycetes bacterium]|nr:hypothetical protein [Planctomycetota bacterium]